MKNKDVSDVKFIVNYTLKETSKHGTRKLQKHQRLRMENINQR